MRKKLTLILFFVINITFLKAQIDERLDSLLAMPLSELMNVEIISATKIPQKVYEAPAIISIITAQQIKERGYNSIADVVRTVPGFSLWEDNLISSIGIRGFNSLQGWNQTLKIMIDGQDVSFRVAGWCFIDEELIPVDCIKRIEFIRGPVSALYGANAYLGVINIITFDGKEFDSFKISAHGGGLETFGGNITIAKYLKGVDFLISYSTEHSDRSGLELPSPVPTDYDSLKSENDISEPKSFYGKISYKGFSLSGNYQQLNRHGEFTDFSVLTHENHIVVDNWFIKSGYSYEKEKLKTEVSLVYGEGKPNRKEHIELNPDYTFYLRRDISVKYFETKFETIYQFKQKNSITFGVDYTTEDQQLQNNYFVDKETKEETLYGSDEPQPRMDFNNLGVYAQGVIYPFKKLGVTTGLRFDYHNIYGSTFSPRLNLVYLISENVYSKLLFGRAYKAPTQRQLYDPSSGQTGDTRGNENLKPQYVNTIECLLGYKLKETANFTITGFYNNISNGIELYNYNDYRTYGNRLNLRSLGIETELIAQFSEITGYVNFSYQNTVNEDTDKETTLVPKITGNLGLNYIFIKFININLESNYVGERISPKLLDANEYYPSFTPNEEYKVDPYWLLNLTLTTKEIKLVNNKGTILSINCKNILNKQFIDPGPENKGFDIPHHGRVLLIKLRQHF